MKSRYAFYVTFALLLAGSTAPAAEFSGGEPVGALRQRFLPVDEAFQLSATRVHDEIRLRWFIMPGYYLYRHALRIDGKPPVEVGVKVPEGIHKVDEYFGEVQIYYEELIIDVPYAVADGRPLQVVYQGCAEAGFCYPPQKEALNVANP